MNFKNFRRTVSGAALTLAMMLGITLASSASAQAQYRDYDRNRSGYGNQGEWPKERTRDYAYKLGYHNAYTEARRAYNSGVRPNYRDMAGYRNDTNGYLDYMRYRDDYRSSYRRGYEAGFNDSMNNRQRRYDRADVERVLGRDLERTYDDDDRYDNRDNRRGDGRGGYYGGGRNDVSRIAQDNGYRDGLRQGQDDLNRRRRYNYNDDSRYRDASSGYRSEYGNRDAYRQAYREGFQRGYDEGYRRNSNNRSGVRLPWPF